MECEPLDIGPYGEGYNAFYADVALAANPYSKAFDNDCYQEWQNGWLDASDDGKYDKD